jgi:glutaredoxin
MQIVLYSASWCRDCRAAKQYLSKHGVVYTEIDIEEVPGASEDVIRHVGKRAVPQLVIDGEWFQPYRPGEGLLFDELNRRLGVTA